MDDHSLRQLVDQFGFCPASVPGALGASAALERYRIPGDGSLPPVQKDFA